MIDRGRIDEPSSCHLCGNTMSMELVHNRCLFTDKQMIRLQVSGGGAGSGCKQCVGQSVHYPKPPSLFFSWFLYPNPPGRRALVDFVRFWLRFPPRAISPIVGVAYAPAIRVW